MGAPYFGVDRDAVPRHIRERGIGHSFICIDPARFMPAPLFRKLVAEMVAAIKRSPRMPEVDEIFVPGELEEKRRRDRCEKGYSACGFNTIPAAGPGSLGAESPQPSDRGPAMAFQSPLKTGGTRRE